MPSPEWLVTVGLGRAAAFSSGGAAFALRDSLTQTAGQPAFPPTSEVASSGRGPASFDPRHEQLGCITQAAAELPTQTSPTQIPTQSRPPPAPIEPPPTLPPAPQPPAPPLTEAANQSVDAEENAHGNMQFRVPVPANGAAASAMRQLVHTARQIGPVPEGAHPAAVARVLDRQRWSAFWCPLLLAAAGECITHEVLQWLMEALRSARFEAAVNGQVMQGPRAGRAGWLALRNAMRYLGIQSADDFVAWMVRDGHSQVQPGAYLHRDTQERVVNAMAETDGGTGALEAAMATAALHFGRNSSSIPAALPSVPRRPAPARRARSGREQPAMSPATSRLQQTQE